MESKDSYQTKWMHRLIRVFAVQICQIVYFLCPCPFSQLMTNQITSHVHLVSNLIRISPYCSSFGSQCSMLYFSYCQHRPGCAIAGHTSGIQFCRNENRLFFFAVVWRPSYNGMVGWSLVEWRVCFICWIYGSRLSAPRLENGIFATKYVII